MKIHQILHERPTHYTDPLPLNMTTLAESKSSSTITLFGNSGCPFARRGMSKLDGRNSLHHRAPFPSLAVSAARRLPILHHPTFLTTRSTPTRTPLPPFLAVSVDEKGLTDQITNVTIPLSGELKAMEGESGLAALPYAAAQWPGQSVEDLVALKASYV